MSTTLHAVGRPTRRQDSRQKLTGAERYAADVAMPGLLHARLVASPHAHALVVGSDTAAAGSAPGVVGVWTAAEIGARWAAKPVACPLAGDEVVYAGQPVAVVVAETEAAAADAAALVEVEYDVLPAVTDPLAALAPDAPVAVLHPRVSPGSGSGPDRGGSTRGSNVAGSVRYRRGDVERALAECDAVVSRTFKTHRIHQGYIEPHATVAAPDPLGGVALWTATQAMQEARVAVADALGLPPSSVRVTATPAGGAFGGKHTPLYEPLVALLATLTGRPVRLVLTRAEEFLATNPAPGCTIELAVGARRDGRLHALRARVVYETGAARGAPTERTCNLLAALYTVPHFEIEGHDVFTNLAPPAAYRGPGGPQAAFALETSLDELAAELGLDPVEFRLANLAPAGEQRPDGTPVPPAAVTECLTVLRDHPAWAEPCAEGEGVGLAVGLWGGSCEPAAADCRLEPDGTLAVVVGSQDISGVNTSLALMAAEAFGVGVDRVRVVEAPSDTAPYAGVSGGSKTTYTVGAAIVQAASAARAQLLALAADDLEAHPEDLEIVGGEVRVRGVPARGRSLAEIARSTMKFLGQRAPVHASATVAVPPNTPGAVAHLARVRVDRETGAVRLLRYVAVQDAGRAINPTAVHGQIHGGAVQGIGFGLHEGMVSDEAGNVVTATFLDYALPRADSLPPIESIIVEVPSATGPYGAKSVGEPPIVPGAAAVANAIRAACGARVTEMPITPPRVLAALARDTARSASPAP